MILYNAYLYQYNKKPILISENLDRYTADIIIKDNVSLGNIIILEVISKSKGCSYLEPYEKYCVEEDIYAVQRCGSAIILSYIYQVEKDGNYNKLDIEGFIYDEEYIKNHIKVNTKRKRKKIKKKSYNYINEDLIKEIEENY